MDPIVFGVTMVYGLCIGLITPPVGNVLYHRYWHFQDHVAGSAEEDLANGWHCIPRFCS